VPTGTKLSPTLGSPAIQCISGSCVKIKTETCFGFYKVKIWVPSVADKAFKSIQDRYPPATIHGGITSITAHVSEPILQAITPSLVADFHAAHPRIVKKNCSDRPAYDPVCVFPYFVASGPRLMPSGRSCPLFTLAILEEHWMVKRRALEVLG